VRTVRSRGGLLLAVLLAGAGRAVPAAESLTDSQRHIKDAGTVLRFGIPAAALLATFVLEPDRDTAGNRSPPWLMGGSPRHDLLLGIGRAWVVTGVLKHTVNAERPDGGKHSFPSGHTSMAFAGAEFLRKEYGWGWGTPALLAAGFVAWSRVEVKRHYTRDVLAGAAIGVLANHDFWRRHRRAGSLVFAPGLLVSERAVTPGLRVELKLP
jgi:hypothetical protein